MDFGTLLHRAKKNDSSKKEVRYYSTKFEPPKKEQRNKKLSANIQKFLAKKEVEERQKAEEVRKKREELLALRAQDKKSTRRVNVMLKRTKSANQSVLQEAVNNDHTAITMTGNSQPDEDDYGYVSQEAAEYYNKMMEKYNKMPDEPKFSTNKTKVNTNLNSIKNRVTAALEREKEEANMPHKRKERVKRKHEVDDEKDFEEEKPVVQPKPKPKPAPPPLNFTDLLKIAEKKQFEPIIIEKKEVKEEERPLTKKQKKELEKEREYLESRMNRAQQKPPANNKIPKIPSVNDKGSNTSKIPDNPARSSGNNVIKSNASIHKVGSENRIKNMMDNKKINNYDVKTPRKDDQRANQKIVEKKQTIKNTDKPRFEEKSRNMLGSSSKSSLQSASGSKSSPLVNKGMRNDEPSKSSALEKKIALFHNSKQPSGRPVPKYEPTSKKLLMALNNGKPKEFPPSDIRVNQKPSLQSKEFPPRDLKPKQFPPDQFRRVHPKKKLNVQKGRILDDDEEYDSEMDDFIDDGPVGDYSNDYSKYISEIFGYDKSKYRAEDEDLDNMESTFAQQMREEVISTKIGIMEDLEDMRMEEEAKRRKAIVKKKQK